jgi:uncharacterized secreted protein with C-terminal beta-propeller domain
VEALEDRTLLSAGPAPFGSEAAFKDYLINLAVQQYSWYFGQQLPLYGFGYIDRLSGGPILAAAGDPSGAASSNTFSQTNTQVQGVDEGDTVKTDGHYLYVLSGHELVILNAWPADQLQIVSETALNGNALVEYLNGDRLIVISQEYQYDTLPRGIADAVPLYRPWFYYWSQPEVDVTVFDVSDPSAPHMVQENTLDGYYVNSRAIGSTVYVALNSYLELPWPEYTSSGDMQVYETEASYRDRLEAMSLDALLPRYTTTWSDASGAHTKSGRLTDPADIYPGGPGELNLMSIVSFDVGGDDPGPSQSVSFLTDGSATLYAATDNFYLISNHWSNDGIWSSIDKISLQGGGLELTATGEVPGMILNQFSVGEDGAYLDIATTTGWGSDASNNVYVLAEHDHTLDIVGSLTGLAPGERIYSVWFMGDRGFVSTFEQVDPLFALDLSDPTAPRVAGSLEVSGYTGYLQPLDATHLLGIGRDVNPATNEPTDLVISLFDVSDLDHPTLVSRYEIAPDGWAWSQALYDYHAITYYPEYQTLTLPVNSDQLVAPDAGSGVQYVYGTGQLVFHVDLASGTLSLQGTIGDSSPICRGVFINNVLYSISDTSVQAHSLNDLSTLVAQVQLPERDYYYWWWRGPIEVLRLPAVQLIPIVVHGKPSHSVPPDSGSTGPTAGTDRATVLSPGSALQPGSELAGIQDTANTRSVVLQLSATAPSGVLSVAATPAQTAAVSGTAGEQDQAAATVPIGLGSQGPTATQLGGGGGDQQDVAPPFGSEDAKIGDDLEFSGASLTDVLFPERVWSDLLWQKQAAAWDGVPTAEATPPMALAAAFLLAAGASGFNLKARRQGYREIFDAVDAGDPPALQ